MTLTVEHIKSVKLKVEVSHCVRFHGQSETLRQFFSLCGMILSLRLHLLRVKLIWKFTVLVNRII